MGPGGQLTIQLTYATVSADQLVPPVVKVPGRWRGSVSDEPDPADAIEVSPPVLVDEDSDIRYEEISGTLVTPRRGYSKTWQIDLVNARDDVGFEALPITALVPKGQMLVDSTLPPDRTERRGRVSSWDNIVPGITGFMFGNYVRVLSESRSLETGDSLFFLWTANSFFIAILKVALMVVIACAGGDALARFAFPGGRAVFFVLLLSMMIPGQVMFISNFLVFRELNLLNTPWAVITAVVASAQVLIMKQFFESIPKEVEEAAIVDGANPLQVLVRIFVPMAKPAVASITILGFQGAWNDFFWPLVVLTSPPDAYTLPVGLLSFRNIYGVAGDWGLILAGSFLSVIPVLLVFIFFQRYFVDSGTSSAVKG